MSNLIRISNLTKKYKKNFALDGLNLEVDNGVVVGILGPNGSGKTTLIKIMAGLIKSYSGEVTINGTKPGTETKSYVSYLPDRNILNNFNKISHCIKYYKKFFDDFDTVKCEDLLNSLSLNSNMKISSLSKGMSEKLHLALTLSRKAKLYILDEPIAGVDPVARDEILNAIINNIDPESTMIISTHLVRDLENIFTEVAFISNGKIVEYSDAEKIRIERGMTIDQSYKKIFGGHNDFVEKPIPDSDISVKNIPTETHPVNEINIEEYSKEDILVDKSKKENIPTEDIIVNKVFKADHSNLSDNSQEKTDEEVSVEETIVEDTNIEEPTVEETIVEKISKEEPIVEETVVEEISKEEPIVEETVVEEISTEESTVEETVAEEIPVKETTIEASNEEKPPKKKPVKNIVNIVEDNIFVEDFSKENKKINLEETTEYNSIREDILVSKGNGNKDNNSEDNNIGGNLNG